MRTAIYMRVSTQEQSVESQRHEPLDHERMMVIIQLPTVVQNANPCFTRPPRAFRDSRPERHKRGLKAVRQDNRLVVTLSFQAAPQVPAFAKSKLTMLDVERV